MEFQMAAMKVQRWVDYSVDQMAEKMVVRKVP
jgi:hypothetical protein